MKYLVVGTGGVGGSVGAFLDLEGKDVTFIARGNHLKKMKEEGLLLKSHHKGKVLLKEIQVQSTDTYREQADVIFVCVKGYDLEEVLPFIETAMHQETVVVPLLNSFGVGEQMSNYLKKGYIMDGCIYILSYIESPGVVVQNDKIFKIVYGERRHGEVPNHLMIQITEDLRDSGIVVEQTENIKKETFKKFSFISSYAACGAYYDVEAYAMQVEGGVRNTLQALHEEIKSLGEAMNIMFEENLCEVNDAIVKRLAPDTTASLQKDLRKGKRAEVDSLIGLVVELAHNYNVEVPTYELIWKSLNKTSENCY